MFGRAHILVITYLLFYRVILFTVLFHVLINSI